MSTQCEYWQSLINRIPDDGLTDDEFDLLATHLRTCRECSGLLRVYAAMTKALNEDDAEPPAALCEGVMARIRADGDPVRTGAGAAPDRPGRVNTGDTRAQFRDEYTSGPSGMPDRPANAYKPAGRRKKRRRWVGFAVAACLVVVIGGAAIAARGVLWGRSGDETMMEKAVSEEFTVSEPYDMPVPEPEAAGEAFDGVIMSAMGDDAAAAQSAPAAETAAVEEAAEPEAAAEEADAGGTRPSAYGSTRDDPVAVPADGEDLFLYLLQDARGAVSDSAASWHVIAAAEYGGVIYEFLTDDAEDILLWQDAAEGVPIQSPGTVADLWTALDGAA